MENDIIIKVENVYKKFSKSIKHLMLHGASDIIKDFFSIKTKPEKLRKGEFWALENISFELKRGETLGIIGVNGSGKTTLLRMLNGIFMPDAGKITINGRTGALIAVGAGFHPLLTGRENVYINGQILGMSKKEIDEKFDDIIDFANIGDFLDTPVKNYSSGMMVRLGFAIAIHSEADILLIDEILSVGDVKFQNKCYKKINKYFNKSKSTIFISHRLREVERLCDRVIMLSKGKMVREGNPNEVIKYYLEENLNEDNKYFISFLKKGIKIFSVSILSESAIKTKPDLYTIDIFENFTIEIIIQNKTYLAEEIFISFLLFDQNGTLLSGKSFEEKKNRFALKQGENIITLNFENPNLNPGSYYFNLKSKDNKNRMIFDIHNYIFNVKDKNNKLPYPDIVGNINFKVKARIKYSRREKYF